MSNRKRSAKYVDIAHAKAARERQTERQERKKAKRLRKQLRRAKERGDIIAYTDKD